MKALNLFKGRNDLALISILMLIILVMIVPLPTQLIDSLIVLNISLTVMVLIVAVYLKKPDDFSAFPAIILIATTLRLAVSISTTRMILSQADAGAIIDTFGSFVTQGSVIVGLVIFLIITTVQFVVITKGSERVAEVAARFTLDALPGRQMSIDSELRSGDITAEEAIKRRKQLEKENQFFGAMDGAMKFVKGDAIAGLIIIAINLLGGMTIGIVSDGLSAEAAAQVYSRLTVGDGLVSQLPALIMAMCAGTIITRVNSGNNSDLGTDITEQLVGQSKSLFMASVLVAGFGFIPGFPTSLFLFAAAVLAAGALFLRKREKEQAPDDGSVRELADGTFANASDVDKSIAVGKDDIFKIALGKQVYRNFDPQQFVAARKAALERAEARTGISLPIFGIEERETLGEHDLVIELDGVSVFRGTVPPGVSVAICEQELLELNELPVVEVDQAWPLRSAFWVDEKEAGKLKDVNIEVIAWGEMLARIGGHYVTVNAARILGFKGVQEIIRDLGKEHEQLASQVSQTLSPVQLLNVLRMLLDDGVPLKPRRILFEALLEGSITGGGAAQLSEQARFALSRQVCANYADDERIIAGYVIEPQLELALRNSISLVDDELKLIPTASMSETLLSDAAARHEIEELNAKPPVIITPADLRRPLSQYLKTNNIAFHVMAFRELAGEFNFNPVGTIGAGVPATGEHDDNFSEAAE